MTPTPPTRAARPGASARADFPLLATAEAEGRPLVYLDNAATTQKPRAVLDALVDYYTRSNSNIGRGYYALSRAGADVYDGARAAVQAWLNAEHQDEIVFTRGTTDGINLVADTLGAQLVGTGDQVVVTAAEHNSNLLPWRRLCELAGAELVVVPGDAGGRVGPEALAAVLGPQVRIVAICHVSNVTGTLNPVAELAAAAHRQGAVVVVDGAQAIPHLPVDVRALGADFYAFSGHKVYGPMGSGALYGRRDLLSGLPPRQVGGGTVKGVRRDRPVSYVPAPARMEAGTPDVAAAVGLATALEYLAGFGWAALRRHDEQLVRTAAKALRAIPGVNVVGAPEEDCAGIVSIAVDGIHPYDVGGHLDRHGIAVRSGVHCASTFLDDLGLLGTVRLSFGIYNTLADVAAAVAVVRTARPGEWTRDHPRTRFLDLAPASENALAGTMVEAAG